MTDIYFICTPPLPPVKSIFSNTTHYRVTIFWTSSPDLWIMADSACRWHQHWHQQCNKLSLFQDKNILGLTALSAPTLRPRPGVCFFPEEGWIKKNNALWQKSNPSVCLWRWIKIRASGTTGGTQLQVLLKTNRTKHNGTMQAQYNIICLLLSLHCTIFPQLSASSHLLSLYRFFHTQNCSENSIKRAKALKNVFVASYFHYCSTPPHPLPFLFC